MKRVFTLAAVMVMAVTTAWAGYFSPTFVSTNADASASVDGETADKMFDGIYSDANPRSKWCPATTRGTWKGRYVIMDAGMPIILRGYRLIAGGDTNTNPGRRWKAWKIYGSNSSAADGEWTLVDQKTDSPTSSANYGVSDYTTTATEAYRYYKLIVDENVDGDVMQMSEMQLAAVLDADYASPAFVSTDITEAVTGQGAERLFDGKYSAEADKWFASTTKGAWKGGYVIMDAGTPIFLQGYRLIAGHDTYKWQGRRWKAWKIYGSNSAEGGWEEVDKKTNSLTSSANFGIDEYTVPVSEAYRYYKLIVDDCASGEEMQMSEMQLAGVAAGTGVTFTSNEAKGFQSQTENVSRSLSGLTFGATTSDWIMDGTVVNNGAVGTAGLKQCIQRRNKGWWSGDLCDWLTLTYEAPSYTKVDYALVVDVSVSKSGEKNSVRAAYHDFGTDADGNWASRTKLSNGTTTYRTSNGLFTPRTATADDEVVAIWMYTSKYGKTDYDENSVTLNVTVDNSKGTEAKSENRYGMFVSSKSNTLNKENILNYSRLRLKYTATATYCNVITFDANEGEGTMEAQTIEGAGTLTANTLTRDGYTFAGWNTQADGKGTAYTDEQAIAVTSETKGAITLYAQWEVSKTPTAIDNIDAQKSSNIIKTVENGKVVIIKEGVKYDITGRKL